MTTKMADDINSATCIFCGDTLYYCDKYGDKEEYHYERYVICDDQECHSGAVDTDYYRGLVDDLNHFFDMTVQNLNKALEKTFVQDGDRFRPTTKEELIENIKGVIEWFQKESKEVLQCRQ